MWRGPAVTDPEKSVEMALIFQTFEGGESKFEVTELSSVTNLIGLNRIMEGIPTANRTSLEKS